MDIHGRLSPNNSISYYMVFDPTDLDAGLKFFDFEPQAREYAADCARRTGSSVHVCRFVGSVKRGTYPVTWTESVK